MKNAISYLQQIPLNEIKVDSYRPPEQSKNTRPLISLEIDGQILHTTDRFWKSFVTRYQKFGLSQNFMASGLFDPSEVFDRIVKIDGNTEFDLAVETEDDLALGIIPADGKYCPFNAGLDLLQKHGGTNIKYHDGVLSAVMKPILSGDKPRIIGNDEMDQRYQFQLPVDGLGDPSFFLMLIRLICTNGMVAQTPAFRTQIKLGKAETIAAKSIVNTLDRAVASFNNEDGFSMYHRRLEDAQYTIASVREVESVYTSLASVLDHNPNAGQILYCFESLTKNPAHERVDLSEIDSKRKGLLKSMARVYDVINFVTEVSTHFASEEEAIPLNGMMGKIITTEFDLTRNEDNLPKGGFKDRFLKTMHPMAA